MSEQNKMISGKEEKQKMVVGSFYTVEDLKRAVLNL